MAGEALQHCKICETAAEQENLEATFRFTCSDFDGISCPHIVNDKLQTQLLQQTSKFVSRKFCGFSAAAGNSWGKSENIFLSLNYDRPDPPGKTIWEFHLVVRFNAAVNWKYLCFACVEHKNWRRMEKQCSISSNIVTNILTANKCCESRQHRNSVAGYGPFISSRVLCSSRENACAKYVKSI